jgi:hypothetical protein
LSLYVCPWVKFSIPLVRAPVRSVFRFVRPCVLCFFSVFLYLQVEGLQSVGGLSGLKNCFVKASVGFCPKTRRIVGWYFQARRRIFFSTVKFRSPQVIRRCRRSRRVPRTVSRFFGRCFLDSSDTRDCLFYSPSFLRLIVVLLLSRPIPLKSVGTTPARLLQSTTLGPQPRPPVEKSSPAKLSQSTTRLAPGRALPLDLRYCFRNAWNTRRNPGGK